MVRRALAGLALLLAVPLAAQEPKPASLDNARIRSGGIDLTLPWRFAPGDDPARAAASFDDTAWATAAPLEPPPDEVGWYRRHLRIAPDLVGRSVRLRVAAPGEIEVFIDGSPVLASLAREGSSRAETTATFASAHSVIAVRSRCAGCDRAFLVRIESERAEAHRLMETGFAVFFATVPLVLALIHFGLWLSDRRALENLFLALCLVSFAGIVTFSTGAELSTIFPSFRALASLVTPAIIAAAFFALMTFYLIRRKPLPRTWIGFAAAAVALSIATWVVDSTAFRNAAWSLYFLALVIEVLRLEIAERTRPETDTRPLINGMTVMLVAITLQIMVVADVIPHTFPWGKVYYLGLIGLAVGTSRFTIKSFDATRRKLERNEGEIASARKLQEAMLPNALPAMQGLEVGAFLSTATDVGGDYYDFRELPDGSLLIAVGDAAGHGLAAGAMVTAMKALFCSVEGDENLAEILRRSDAVLRRMDVRLLHMCLTLVRFRGGAIEVCSAAMPPALIHRAATGRVEELGAGGLPLGGRLRGQWESRTATLAPGDTVLLASDGLGEMLNSSGNPFGF
ncbi:MAG TPA: SpoIIE family protein phosphatase, partial [Thermoanaerobaculia bacterium]|nr:SpoIIE family protein phosphatase [Thermoanaerobaculia bacterium]